MSDVFISWSTIKVSTPNDRLFAIQLSEILLESYIPFFLVVHILQIER